MLVLNEAVEMNYNLNKVFESVSNTFCNSKWFFLGIEIFFLVFFLGGWGDKIKVDGMQLLQTCLYAKFLGVNSEVGVLFVK